MAYPVFVSFYAGSRYYYDAAERLASDCRRLGIPLDIEELEVSKESDWAAICRMKSRFLHRKLEQHKAPIFWLDVDTRVLVRPPIFEGSQFDFAAFLRNFTYLRRFDPVQYARTFHPGFLFFNYTDPSRRFAERIADLEARTDKRATDDYFLEEAWRNPEEELDIALLPPKRIARGGQGAATPPEAWFLFGESGRVSEFISQVEQHNCELFEARRQVRTLKSLAQADTAKGDLTSATVFLKKVTQLDPTQDDAVHMLGRVLRRQKRTTDAIGEYEARLSLIEAREPDSQRHRDFLAAFSDFALQSGELDLASDLVERLMAAPEPKAQAVGRSRRFRISLEQAARLLPKGTPRVRLWWMEQPYPGNFGDVLNPYIVEKLSGAPPIFSPAGLGVLAVGSTIKFARPGTQVWGTGSPRLTDRLSAEADYRAVRGPITRRLVRDSGAECPDVFGDPALLLPVLYRPRVRKRHAVGLVRHVSHREEPVAVSDDVKEIDVRRCGYEEIERFIDEMCECEAIISTSLHGLIVAQAYGIPAVWATFGSAAKGIPGVDVKFHDYFASIGIHEQQPLDLSEVRDVSPGLVRGRALTIRREPRLDRLVEAAPFEVRFDGRGWCRESSDPPTLETVAGE